jgi:hypothetical protein
MGWRGRCRGVRRPPSLAAVSTTNRLAGPPDRGVRRLVSAVSARLRSPDAGRPVAGPSRLPPRVADAWSA